MDLNEWVHALPDPTTNNSGSYECLRCRQEHPGHKGWVSTTGFICDRCQQKIELKILEGVKMKQMVIIRESNHKLHSPGGSFYIYYKPGWESCQVFVGDSLSYTADKIGSGLWEIRGGWFNIIIEEV